MKQIITIVKPFLAERVIREVEKFPLEELVVREAKGFGRQKNYLDQYSNNEFSLVYVPKVEICAWVQPEHVAAVVEAIIAVSRTGRPGDGKIMVLPVMDSVDLAESGEDVLEIESGPGEEPR